MSYCLCAIRHFSDHYLIFTTTICCIFSDSTIYNCINIYLQLGTNSWYGEDIYYMYTIESKNNVQLMNTCLSSALYLVAFYYYFKTQRLIYILRYDVIYQMNFKLSKK